jgi:hypothetical protein
LAQRVVHLIINGADPRRIDDLTQRRPAAIRIDIDLVTACEPNFP